MTDETTRHPAVDPLLDAAAPAHDPVQQELPLDEPIPYALTTRGRRLVAPDDLPTLRVVGGVAGPVDLDEVEGTERARARALRRAGMHTLDIADEIGVEPLHVEAWVADLPVPVGAGASRRRRQLRVVADAEDVASTAAAVRARWEAAAETAQAAAADRLVTDPSLLGGLGLLSGVLEPDHHALVLTGAQQALVTGAWRWVVDVLGPVTTPARVLVRHGATDPGDRLAREVAAATGLDPSAVSTTRDPARTGLPPLLRLRVSDPELAGTAAGWQRALLSLLDGTA